MANAYPNPCGKCTSPRCSVSGDGYKNCQAYHTWLNWWWKRFKVIYFRTEKPNSMPQEKFTYEHPDHTRKWLEDGPCNDCRIAESCDTACAAYLRWYDARMEITRKKVGA